MKPIKGADVVAAHSAELKSGQRKFCGYLRKKRNKVGGWSKLWFVLQDRLLVSYKSREDYYNKLVSFKDVLNLMPGTQIRPLEGFNFRFTIETTTQAIYTFHCDDRAAYREWVSKLLDCLATSRVAAPPMRRLCPHFSVDDLTYAHAHITTRSFDSIIGAEPNVLSRKSHVEKILERNVDCLYEHSAKRQSVKQHIERMSITGENECRRESHPEFKEQQRHSKLMAKQSTEERILRHFSGQSEPDAPPVRVENEAPSHIPTIMEPEPVYAVVDLRNKYIQRKKRLMAMQGKRWNSYESIFPTVEELQEPRADLSTEAIYEDGDAFYSQQVDDQACFQIPPWAEEENIYEPINVSEQATTALNLRKYISRLTLKPFLRLHRSHKSSDRKDSKLAVHLDLTSPAKASSKFSTMRSKLGVHRKSVQRRIRRLYGGNYEPNPLFQYHNEATPMVVPCDKARRTIAPANKIPDLRSDSPANVDPPERRCEHQKEKPKTFDSLPHFKRAVARIALFNSSTFKSPAQRGTPDTVHHRNISLID